LVVPAGVAEGAASTWTCTCAAPVADHFQLLRRSAAEIEPGALRVQPAIRDPDDDCRDCSGDRKKEITLRRGRHPFQDAPASPLFAQVLLFDPHDLELVALRPQVRRKAMLNVTVPSR